MGSVGINGHRLRAMPVLVAVALATLVAAPSASAQEPAGAPSPAPVPAPPPGYTMGGQGFLLDHGRFTPVAVPGAVGTLAAGLNDRGQIVGVYDDRQGRSHGFLYERGRYRTIDHPQATGTDATGLSGSGLSSINDRGQAVGTYVGPDNRPHAYLLDVHRGRFRTIDAPGATDTNGFGLNDRGQMTIQASSPDEPFLHFLYDDGEFTRVQFPGAEVTIVHKIDNRGQVVGVYIGADGIQHGFTLRHGRYRRVDYPDAPHTGLNDSNTRGQLVGYVLEGDLTQPTAVHGALFSRGRLTTFDAPGPPAGPTVTSAYDINDRGQIVGVKLPL
jgi:probable HAF family extracellular repeat protein